MRRPFFRKCAIMRNPNGEFQHRKEEQIMTSRKAPEGKPYAGNPAVRFDEKEVASTMPRHESLLCKLVGVTRVVLLAVAGVGMSVSAFGGSFHIKDGASNWTVGGSFTEGSAPQSGDVVILPTNVTVHLNASTDSDSLARVNSLDKICFTGNDSRLEITVSGSDVKEITTPMTAFTFEEKTLPASIEYTGGPIVKKGTGTLILSSSGKMPANPDRNYDYYSQIVVEAGSLKVNPNLANPCWRTFLGRVRVEEGAFLFTSCCGWQAGATYLMGLSGDGTVTNEPTAYPSELVFNGTATYGDTSDFAGQLNGEYSKLSFSGDAQTLSGTNSCARVSNGVYLNGGSRTRLAALGISSTTPSSVGYQNDSVYVQADKTATTELELAGNGGVTFGQGFVFESSDDSTARRAAVINAGAKGGCTFAGSWQRRYSSSGGRSLVLTGDNEEPCVVACAVHDNHNSSHAKGRGHSLYISKEGSGTWRFDSTARPNFTSGISVNEGILEYASIAPVGVACSIGVSTNLTDGQWGAADTNAEHRVDYAIRLGAPTLDGTSKTSGRFSYIGTGCAGNLDRKVALAGAGGFRSNASSGGIVHGDVYGISSQPMSLYLDGDDDTDDNVVSKVSDGTAGGKVTIIKEGSGKWHIGPASDFTGGIDVRGGELVLDPARYSWYRWTITDLYPMSASKPYSSWKDGSTDKKELMFYEFALYDENGYNQVEHYQTNAKIGSATEIPLMEPGTAEMFAYGDNKIQSVSQTETVGGVTSNYYMDVWKAFDLSTSGYGVWGVSYKLLDKNNNQIRIDGNDPDTRMSMVIRLKPDAHDVVSYDYMNVYGGWSAHWPTAIRASYLDASVDGITWERLHTSTDAPVHYDGGMWAFQGGYTDGEDGTHASANRHTDSMELASPRNISLCPTLSATPSASSAYAADSVKISGGGRLTVAGGASALTIRSLEIDAQTGGTIDGATLDSNLSLSLVNLPDVAAMEIPVMFTNVVGLADVSGWMVTYNGKSAGSWYLAVRDGRLSMQKRGIRIIFR